MTMRKSIALCLSLLALCPALTWAITFRYVETCGKNTGENLVTLAQDETTGIVTLDARDSALGERHIILADATGTSVSWTYHFASGEVKVFSRSGDRIAMSVNGAAPVETAAKLDSDPWFASPDFSLAPFVASGKKEITFWTVNPANGKAFKMRGTRKECETLSLNGKTERAVKVEVTADNVPAVFFSMQYWFREADCLFLKFAGTRGGPGSPKILVEFAGAES
jgi:hypothetical protein